MKNFLLFNVFIMTLATCTPGQEEKITIQVDASVIRHTMKGGMGASWHAISKEMALNNEKYSIPARDVNSRGSAYGGNPPVSEAETWKQIKHHASWLGLNFIRVELSQRMYEPERKHFDWDNDEMRALYQILDWAEENQADVFLQQMWGYVEWNSVPGIHPLISAPGNLDDFADGIATLLEYLTNERGYTCIKYFCMTNEPPGGTWGYWWESGEQEVTLRDAWKRLKEEFDKRDIHIPISGPDWTDMPPFEVEKLDFAEYLGAIDIHSYHGVTEEGEENLRQWAEWAHRQGKPFFLSEFGNMNLGWGEDNPGPKTFEAALSNACDVVRGLRAGVDGFNRWSFTNRGNLDGQWQLIRTYDTESGTYLPEVEPEPEAYYGFGIISRFMSKYSSTLSCRTDVPDSILMATALLSPSGEIGVILINRTSQTLDVALEIQAFDKGPLYIYQVDPETVVSNGFELKPVKRKDPAKNHFLTLPEKSITNVSSFLLDPGDKGIVLD